MTENIAPDTATPETDDATFDLTAGVGMDGSNLVDADFARNLERQRNALQALIDGAKGELPPEPSHTPECVDQNLITWRCVCEFDARKQTYVEALREAAVSAIAKERQLRQAAVRQLEEIDAICLSVATCPPVEKTDSHCVRSVKDLAHLVNRLSATTNN